MDVDTLTKISEHVENCTQKLLEPTGKFIYQYDVNNHKAVKGKYNLLRHFGTLWYLGESTNEVRRAYAVKGLKWANKYLQAYKDGTDAYVYKNEIKTGGLALAILAKLALNDLKYIEPLAEFLLNFQKKNGDFVHKLDAELNDTGFESEYYTGEIIFALASLHAVKPNPQLIKAVAKSLDYLIGIGYGIKEQSHWMLYALNAAYAVNHNSMYPAHSSAIVANIIKYPDYMKRGGNPIACRVEGMLAHSKIMKQQFPTSDTHLARMSYIESNIKVMLESYQKGYFVKDGICQIDNNQHCGTALRNYIIAIREIK